MFRAASCSGIDLHADGVLLRAENLDTRNAAHHRDALREKRFGVFVRPCTAAALTMSAR